MSVIETITNFCTSLCLPVVRDIPVVNKKVNAKPATPIVEVSPLPPRQAPARLSPPLLTFLLSFLLC
jgi:hypothetical protein